MTLHEIIKNKEIQKEYNLVLQTKDIYRTNDGLHIFTVTDGKDSFKLTTYTPGKVAYADVEKGDVKSYTFKTKIFQGNLQGDLMNIEGVSSQIIAQFKKDIEEAAQSAFAPTDKTLLIDMPSFVAMKESMLNVAAIIRQAVIEKRPIHITHHGDCDGFSAGILLEQSIIDLIGQYHPTEKYLRQYMGRNPSKPPYYDIIDATRDIGFFLSNSKRFGVRAPLILIVDNGSTKQDLISIEKVKLYGADVAVIDHHDPGVLDAKGKSIICKQTLAHVNPHLHGYKEGISASMLCYQIAHYINEKFTPSPLTAAAGGVADRCETPEVQFLIEQSKKSREYIWQLAMMVDYEIYMTKMNIQAGGIYTLLSGTDEQRNTLVSLYQPILDAETQSVKRSLEKYTKQVKWGSKQVCIVDGEATTLWSDYFTIGKIAGIAFDMFAPDVLIAHSDSIIVFRAKQDSGFDVNALLKDLIASITYARISGGGHAVAGSIKFLSAAKQEILSYIQKNIENS